MREKGFAHPILLVAVFSLVGLGIVTGLQNLDYSKNNSANIQGLETSTGYIKLESVTTSTSKEPSLEEMERRLDSANPPGPSVPVSSNHIIKPQGGTTTQPQEDETNLDNELENELNQLENGKVEFENDHGKIKVEVKEVSGSSREINQEQEKHKIKVKTGQREQEIELEAQGDEFKMKIKGSEAFSHFPLSLDPVTGQLMVKTSQGLKPIRILPDSASVIATTSGIVSKLEKIELQENKDNSEGEAVFKVSGVKRGVLLGFIPVVAPTSSLIGANTGQILKTDTPFWFRLLSFFIK